MTTEFDLIIPVYADGNRLARTLRSVFSQRFSSDILLRVILYDDASPEPVENNLPESLKEQIILIRGKRNLGRSGARNAGMAAGTAPLVGFLDADCVYTSSRSLDQHIQTLMAGADVSVGLVMAGGKGFWARYQAEVASRRSSLVARGDLAVLTSANLAIRRATLVEIGGFSEDYRHYGFEDRDLIERLLAAGARVVANEQSQVWHDDDLSLTQFCLKMFEAARFSAPVFYRAHGEKYSTSNYGRLDLRLHAGANLPRLFRKLEGSLGGLAALGDWLIAKECVPYPIKKWIVKMTAALCYTVGSAGRPDDSAADQ